MARWKRSTYVQLPEVCQFWLVTWSKSRGDLNHNLGTGAFKLGVNYAPGVLAQKLAAKHGYAQNLWLHGPNHYLTEV